VRISGFRTICIFLFGSFLFSIPAQGFEPEAGLLLRLYSSDSSAGSERELPRGNAAGKDDLEGAGRLTLGVQAEPLDQVVLKLSLLSAARWGSDDEAIFEAGESFLKLENIAMLPLSVSVGRQTISWGRGLLFSSENGDHLFDMVSASWDTLPHRFDVFYADPALSVFDSPVNHLWLARWFYQAEGRSSAEIFGGALSLENDGKAAIAGLRGIYAPGPKWETRAELAGEAGERNPETDLSALIADLGIARHFSKGRIQASWTWASGSDDEENSFIPLFNGEHWGRLYDPPLSNIHIFTASAVREITDTLELCSEYFSYWKASDGGMLGSEIDLVASCELSEALSLELSGCLFFTEEALRPLDDNTQSEIRLQMSFAF